MSKNVATLEPEHGLIIVDTCVLSSIAEKIDAEFLINPDEELKDKHWADMLGLLAKHGFSVKIPEMVAFESADMLADGKNCDALFQHRDDFSQRRYALMTAAQKNRVTFLNSVIRGTYGNNADITIESPDARDNSESANFIRSYRKLITSIKKMQASGLRNLRDKAVYNAELVLLANLKKKENLPLKNFGDQAAEDIIKLLPKDWSKPVFYLTEDHAAFTAAKTVRPDLKICQINATGYLNALQESGVLESFGVQLNDKAPEEIVAQMCYQDKERYDDVHRLYIEANKSDRSRRLDSPAFLLIDGAGGKNVPNDFSFRDAVFAEKDEILAAQKAEKTEDVVLSTEQEQQVLSEQEQAKQSRFKRFSAANAKSLQKPHGHGIVERSNDGKDDGAGRGRR